VKQFTLEYWKDDGWYVRRLKEMPAVMSQGKTLGELQAMIRDAYHLVVEDAAESAFVPKEKQELSPLSDLAAYLGASIPRCENFR
jgi:predicted RNase H-like HicB family nuclease